MQKEYKDAMERISLSDSDKERILANVKKACEIPEEEKTVISIRKRPDFSLRRMGAVAAACLVLCASALLVIERFTDKNLGVGNDIEGSYQTQEPGEEVVWEELDSICDIGEKTDCKTYTLSNVPREYRLKKIQVAREQRHVRIVYKNKKEHDKILFEYKETDDVSELASQFEGEQMLAEETVGNADVTLYGAKKCNGMTWKKSSCSFAVRMTKGRSKKDAKALVSGTAEGIENVRDIDKKDIVRDEKKDKSGYNPNAIGWQGDEEPSGPAERRRILKSIYELLGFRITVVSPGEQITYKQVGDYESFLFYYPLDVQLEDKKIIGYAGWESCPEGVLKGYEEADTVTVNGVVVYVYQNRREEKLFRFKKQDISFTFLMEGYTGTDYEQILGELLSVVRISMDDGISDDEKVNDNSDNKENESTEKAEEEKVIASAYREQAQKIQDAVAERSLHKMMSYVQFPLVIDNQGGTVSSEKDFLALDASRLFTSEWIDAVVSYDVFRIDAHTKTFVMGSDTNYLVCKTKENSVVIAEIHSAKLEPESVNTNEA